MHFYARLSLVQIPNTLNLSDVTSKVRRIAMFVACNVQKCFTQICRYVYDLSPHKTSHSYSNCALVIAIRRKAETGPTSCGCYAALLYTKKKVAHFSKYRFHFRNSHDRHVGTGGTVISV